MSECLLLKDICKWYGIVSTGMFPLSVVTSQSPFPHLLNGVNYTLSHRTNKALNVKATCILEITVQLFMIVLRITLPVSLQLWNFEYFQIIS